MIEPVLKKYESIALGAANSGETADADNEEKTVSEDITETDEKK